MATTVLLFVLAGMGLILLVMMVLFGNSNLLISQNLNQKASDPDAEDEEAHAGTTKHSAPDTQTETAFVIRKSDERQRLLDEFHHSSILNEKYALIFRREDGSEFQLSCSKAAHSKMPYRVTGKITFRNQKFLKFESEKETVSDEYSIIAS